jgi:hypothetical protein
MRIDSNASYALAMRNPANNAAIKSDDATSNVDQTGSTGTSATGSSRSGTTQADFSHMTRKGLADWMNSKIKSGEMSLDDSSAFLGMTMKVPVGAGRGDPIGFDDQEPVNFMQTAQDGIAWARHNNDTASVKRLEAALNAMRQEQGQVTGVDITV